MLNIKQLESRWFIYKLKSFIPYIVFIIILIIILVVSIFTNTKKSTKNKEINTTKTIKKSKVIEEKVILKPSYNFMKNMQTIKKENIPAQKKPIKQITYKNNIHIKKQTTKSDIDILIKRFKTNKNPTLSLFIAKKYYKQKNYKQAYKYAFITNELDNKLEESWIIFIKSMIKLERKDKAIQTLKQYIQYSNSIKAKKLIEDVRLGKFK